MTFADSFVCRRVTKSPIIIVKLPSPDSEMTWRAGNTAWAPIAWSMALAMHSVTVVLDFVHPAPASAPFTRRVSCGLIHFGGPFTTPNSAAHSITPGKLHAYSARALDDRRRKYGVAR